MRFIFLAVFAFISIAVNGQRIGSGAFDYPNCYIRYVYDAAGQRTQRYYYCPVPGGGTGDPGDVSSGLAGSGSTAPRPAPSADSTAANSENSEAPDMKGAEVRITTLYPNPTSGKCIVAFSAALDKALLTVSDMRGVVLQRHSISGVSYEFNIGDLLPAQYSVTVYLPKARLSFVVTKL